MAQSQSITTTPSSPALDTEISRLLSVSLASLREDGRLPKPLASVVRARFERRRTVVLASLKAATPDEIKPEIARLMASFPSLRGASRADAMAMLHQFVEALRGVPLWALRGVCRDVTRGSVPGLNPDFPPTAPRLRQLVDIRDTAVFEEARSLQRLLNAGVAPPDNSDRGLIVAGFKELLEHLREPERPSTFKAPTFAELQQIYNSGGRKMPGAPPRNVGRNEERNDDVRVDVEYAEYQRDAVAQ